MTHCLCGQRLQVFVQSFVSFGWPRVKANDINVCSIINNVQMECSFRHCLVIFFETIFCAQCNDDHRGWASSAKPAAALTVERLPRAFFRLLLLPRSSPFKRRRPVRKGGSGGSDEPPPPPAHDEGPLFFFFFFFFLFGWQNLERALFCVRKTAAIFPTKWVEFENPQPTN